MNGQSYIFAILFPLFKKLSYQNTKYYLIESYYMEGNTPDELFKYVYEPDC